MKAYDLLRKGVEDLVKIYSGCEDTYGIRGNLEYFLALVDIVENGSGRCAPDTLGECLTQYNEYLDGKRSYDDLPSWSSYKPQLPDRNHRVLRHLRHRRFR